MNWRSLIVRFVSVLVALSLALLILLLGGDGEGPGKPHSSSNRADEGWSAWRRMLEALGYPARVFEEPPGRARPGEMLLVLPGVPEQSEEQQALPDHERTNYLRFMENGGTLLAPADEAMLAFLDIELGLSMALELELESSESVETWRARLPTDETLTLASGPAFAPLEASGTWREVVIGDRPGETGRALVAQANVGSGKLVLVSDPTLFENARIVQLDHALYGVRLIEMYSAGQPICFDEFSLGAWSPPSALSLAFRGVNAWISVHLLVIVLLFVWMRAHVAAFARDPLPLQRVSALALARTRARSLTRGRHAGAAASACIEAFLTEGERRLGCRPRPGANTGQRLDALERRNPALAQLRPRLATLPASPAELEDLQRELLRWQEEHWKKRA
jgi:hypothetical protein